MTLNSILNLKFLVALVYYRLLSYTSRIKETSFSFFFFSGGKTRCKILSVNELSLEHRRNCPVRSDNDKRIR